jgi:hypothetical protein
MKNFIKSVDWKKFLRYMLYFFVVVTALYIGSLMNGRNIFPENLRIVFLTTAGWGVMLSISAFTDYLILKSKQNKNGGSRN